MKLFFGIFIFIRLQATGSPDTFDSIEYYSSLCNAFDDEFKSKVSPQLEAPSHIYEGTFHQNIRIFLTIGQVFALMPINGISGTTSSSLNFSFCSPRIVYTILIMAVSCTMAVITFYWNTLHDLKFENVVPLIWFTVNTLVIGQYVRVGRKWPTLMKHWETLELSASIRDNHTHVLFRRLIRMSSIGVPTLAGIEHLLSLANNVNTARSCKYTKDRMNAYFKQAFPAYYAFFKVNYVNGVGLQLLNLFCTFTWNFTDNFIIILSLGLITQFRHFNVQFERYKGMCLPEDFWGKQRAYYNKLLNLIAHVNQDLAAIILISYSNNLFYICLQLFHSVTPSNSIIRSIYFWYSLIYLIGRMIVVSMTAAFIHDEARKPIKVLQLVPSAVYRSETKRFMEQLSSNTIALSGMQFFYLTRKFMLSITGTIITYELVLIQLQRDPETTYDPCEG